MGLPKLEVHGQYKMFLCHGWKLYCISEQEVILPRKYLDIYTYDSVSG